MSRGSRLPNARPKLMFDHVDQSFLQIMCGLYRSPYIQNTRNFPQNLRSTIAATSEHEFWPPPPVEADRLRNDRRANRRIREQTNNKQTKLRSAISFRLFVCS